MVLGITLISVQGLFGLVLLTVLAYELCAKDYEKHRGNIRIWKTIIIFVCEVSDVLLEIAIVSVFTHINFDYDAHRTRKFDVEGAEDAACDLDNTINSFTNDLRLLATMVCLLCDKEMLRTFTVSKHFKSKHSGQKIQIKYKKVSWHK